MRESSRVPDDRGRYLRTVAIRRVPARGRRASHRHPAEHALAMMLSCGPDVPPSPKFGVQLGRAMASPGSQAATGDYNYRPKDRRFRRLGPNMLSRYHLKDCKA